MKIYHRPELDYLSIEFVDEVESKSVFENGMIIKYNKKGHVIGLDITDSMQFFMSDETVEMKDAVKILDVSESTIRRLIKAKKIKATKPNGKDFRFKKTDLILFKKAS